MNEPGRSSETHVTLRDIARELGVCHATVSMALRDDPRISERRRKEIKDAAVRLKYRPNASASHLGHQRRPASSDHFRAEIAWVSVGEKLGGFRAYREFERYWTGAAETTAARGYRLEEFLCNASNPPLRLQEIFRARNIQGIFFAPQRSPVPEWDGFAWEEFSAVRFGYSVRSPKVHLITSDQLANSFLAAQQIRALGYSRLGFVTGAKGQPRGHAGFLQFQDELQRTLQLPRLILPECDIKEDISLLSAWIKRARPDAILTDVRSLRSKIETSGYKVPGDIGLAALSVLDVDCDAGIEQHSEEIGQVAAETLLSMIDHRQRGIPRLHREILIGGSWMDGTMLPGRSGITERPSTAKTAAKRMHRIEKLGGAAPAPSHLSPKEPAAR